MTDRFQQHVAQGRSPQLVKDRDPQDDPATPDGYAAVRRIRSFHFADVVFRRHDGTTQAFPWVYLRSWLGDGKGTRLTLIWPEMVVSLTGRHLDTIEENIMRRIVAEFRQVAPGQADQVPAGVPVILTMDVDIPEQV